MFSFWNRKSNKASAAGRAPDTLPQPFEQHADEPPPSPAAQRRQSIVRQEEPPLPPPPPPPPPPAAPVPESVVVPLPTPHDSAVSEVHAKMLQVERLSAEGPAPRTPFDDPLSDAASAPRPTAEPLFDPASGTQRGFFEPLSVGGPGDSEQHPDEAWTHLARIRELQSEIATMHMRMEGIGDGGGSMDVEVDVDVDVDTVPTQEEEEAAAKEKEFAKLPSRFKGRSDDIDAMMAKLDALSQAVTTFHALQPPPLNFDSSPTSRENTRADTFPPIDQHANPATVQTRPGIPTAAMIGTRVRLDKTQIADVMHDSPISFHAAVLPPDVSTK